VVLAIAKAAPSGSVELANEVRVLRALEAVSSAAFRAPRVLGAFTSLGMDVVLMEVLQGAGHTDRTASTPESTALSELAELSDALRSSLTGAGRVAVHGDFCGWNSSRGRSALSVWDWEWAHMGEPLEDWFHWQTQRLVHFGHGSVDELVRSAIQPTTTEADLYTRVGASPANAPVGLAASVHHGLARLEPEATGPQRSLREEVLARLDGVL
jgi:hypothetical protein